MVILKESALAVLALVLFLFVSNLFLGPGENDHIKDTVTSNGSWIGADRISADRLLAQYSITNDGPLIGTDPASARRWVARYVAPATRVRQVFAQFVPGEHRNAI
jgi:hypothetical protein